MAGEAETSLRPEPGEGATMCSASASPLTSRGFPVLSGNVIRRALLKTLSSSATPLVVVSAPAGSGKTTLLLQWMESERHPTGSLQLEAAHNDPVVFVSNLARALGNVARIDPMVASWTRWMVPPLRERIVPSLVAAVGAARPFLFVLDDAHLLTDKRAWEIVGELLRVFPHGSRLAVGTRSEPRLPISRLQAAGAVLELDGQDLAFSVEETMDFLALRDHDVGLAEAAALQSATEGWAAGISLATLAHDRNSLRDAIQSIRGDQRSIARYLTKEVLERQTDSIRNFLLETSVLDRLTDESCNLLTGRRDAGQILARLSRDNLFVKPIDDMGSEYRYHRLFADLLKAELRRRDVNKLKELHDRAADWSKQQGDLEQAIRHSLSAGQVERAGDMICQSYFLHFSQGKLGTVRRWLGFFTDAQIQGSVPLTLTAGWVASMAGDKRAGRLWSAAALSQSVDDSPMPSSTATQRASQVALRAGIAPDGVAAMRRDAESAWALIADTDPIWRAGHGAILGAARWLSGDNKGAEEVLRRVTAEGNPHNVIGVVGGFAQLSFLLGDEARWDEAEYCANEARLVFEDYEEMGVVGPTVIVPVAEARVQVHRGLPLPEGHVETVKRTLAQAFIPEWIAMVSAVLLGETALKSGDLSAAEQWAAQGRKTLRAWPDAGILKGRLERLGKAIEERRIAEPLTAAEGRVLELLSTYLTTSEIAGRLFISQNTLKTHLRALFRKLDAHSRSEAVERARERGLIKG